MTLPGGFQNILRALRNPNYGIYTAGSSVSLIGTWMQRVAVGWLAWQLTESGAWLGAVAFADLFPTVVVGPLAGAAADRWDRLKTIRLSQGLAMLQALALFILTGNGADILQRVRVGEFDDVIDRIEPDLAPVQFIVAICVAANKGGRASNAVADANAVNRRTIAGAIVAYREVIGHCCADDGRRPGVVDGIGSHGPHAWCRFAGTPR